MRTALPTCLRVATALRPGETVETQQWGAGRHFPSCIVVEERAGALATVHEWRCRDTVWADGLRLRNSEPEAACI